jgi:hypothetical protein
MATNGKTENVREMVRTHAKGFKLVCVACGQLDAEITLDLADLSSCRCSACDDTFAVTTAVSKLREALAEWERLQAMVG